MGGMGGGMGGMGGGMGGMGGGMGGGWGGGQAMGNMFNRNVVSTPLVLFRNVFCLIWKESPAVSFGGGGGVQKIT
jgi:hypothetical protein